MVATAHQVLKGRDVVKAGKLFDEAIGLMEKLLPHDNSAFQRSLKIVCSEVLKMLQEEEEDAKALYILKNIEAFLRKKPGFGEAESSATLFNTLALVFRRAQQYRVSIGYLKRAQALNFKYNLNNGITDMNAAAVYTLQGEYRRVNGATTARSRT